MTLSMVVLLVVEADWHSMVRNSHESLYIGFSTFCMVTHVKISAQRSPLPTIGSVC